MEKYSREFNEYWNSVITNDNWTTLERSAAFMGYCAGKEKLNKDIPCSDYIWCEASTTSRDNFEYWLDNIRNID